MEILILFLIIPFCKFIFRAFCRIVGGVLYIIGCGISAIERGRAERIAKAQRAEKERIAVEQQRARLELIAKKQEQQRIKDEEKKQREMERDAREKERHDWQREKMEWARQKEQDRRQELEWKRKQREQIEKEREKANQEDTKQRKRELALKMACADLDYIDQSMTDLTPLVDQYRETFENTVTDKTKWNAYKKLYQLEQRQNRLDKQRMKALYTLGGA